MSGITGSKKIWIILFAVTAIFGLYLRCSGTFRGLDTPYYYHPDEPKQVTALHNYLQGHYVWHTGSLFYDGYPYGLNHVDEWILRPILTFRNFTLRTLYGTSSSPTIPAMPEMYYWARGLRVLYGMIVLCLAYLVTKRLFNEPGIRWLAFTLIAIAPLSVCVTHTATGDIGVDLFGALTIVMLCLFAEKTQPRYLFLAGLATGMAFGCKYNGMLLAILTASYLTLQLLSDKRTKAFLTQGLTATAGCILGILLSTPAFLINFRQTRKDMLDNFTFIKNYDVESEFAAKPFHVKAWTGLIQNTPTILQAFGYLVVILAALGLIAIIWKLHKKQTGEPEEDRMDRFAAALFSFPFIALIISLAGKPKVQPFHFSYLQIPLIFGAVYAIAWLQERKFNWSNRIAVLCSIITMTGLGIQTMKENFFWQREDNTNLAGEMSEIIFGKSPAQDGLVIKNVYLEPGGVSAFRNREPFVTSHLDASKVLPSTIPVPTIPYPVDHEWIFLNGPVFPLNDRMFTVNNNEIKRKHLVFHNRPGKVNVGFRSSAWPVQAVVNLGNDIKALSLRPNEQRILTFSPVKWRCFPEKELNRESFIVPIEIETKTGNMIATILDTDYERKCYSVFGGTATNYIDILPVNKDRDIQEYLAQTRYVDSNKRNHFEGGQDHSTRVAIPSKGMFLPCGAYELECDVNGLASTSSVSFMLTDSFNTLKQFHTEKVVAIKPGRQQVVYRFSKYFSPYLCQIQIQAKSGEFSIESWNLHPDLKTITSDLKIWQEINKAPEWAKRYPESETWTGKDSELYDITFDKAILLKRLEYEPSIKCGGPFSVKPFISVTFHPYQDYDAAYMFFHLLDQSGRQIAAFDLSLREAVIKTFAESTSTLSETPNLSPGTYELWVGMWNTYTHKRLSSTGARPSRIDNRKRRVYAGTLKVTPEQKRP